MKRNRDAFSDPRDELLAQWGAKDSRRPRTGAVPSEYDRSEGKKSQLPGGGKWLLMKEWALMIGVLFFSLGILSVMVFLWIPKVIDFSRLQLSGSDAQGSVVDMKEYASDYFISYTFLATEMAAGKSTEFTATQAISRRTFRRINEGTLVMVRYLPSAPEVSRLWGKDGDISDIAGAEVLAGFIAPFMLWGSLKWIVEALRAMQP